MLEKQEAKPTCKIIFTIILGVLIGIYFIYRIYTDSYHSIYLPQIKQNRTSAKMRGFIYRSNKTKTSTNTSYFKELFHLSARNVLHFDKPTYLSKTRNPCFYADISSKEYLG